MISVEEAKAYYEGTDPAHDFEHVLRVLALAEKIGAEERADLEVLRAAVLLHDIGRGDEERGLDHAQTSADMARSILAAKGWPEDRIERVREAILSHRFRAGPEPLTLEARILYDADKLDAIGAIGIARAYAVAGKYGQRLWAEMPPGYSLGRENLSGEHTPNFEYILKLRLLKDNLFTITARRIAAERHRFMVDFFQCLEGEIRGEF
ncbi:MAG: HD domain-containing protein [Chloroflexi bacterium]|nr:HD domain-containing protein [Chloroflexota bacterium]